MSRLGSWLALAKRWTAPITRFGWSILAVGVAAWIVADALSWVEFGYLAVASSALFVVCLLTAIGRAVLAITLEVQPTRVVVGTSAVGRVTVRNRLTRRALPLALELPVGAGALRFSLPSLAANAEHEEIFVIPTFRRGVIRLGPATTVRGDPMGLVRRAVTWTESIELFVHPHTIPIESIGFGLLRDLEGQTTNEVSMSDLAFHALRDYSPGDDRRYIHWRSSAKAGRFLVRQFLDTRRLHLALLVDSDPTSYRDESEYELAISAAASLALCSVRNEQDTTVIAGDYTMAEGTGRQILDVLARAELGAHASLARLSAKAMSRAKGASLAFVISGSHVTFAELQRAFVNFPSEAKKVALTIDPHRPLGMSVSGLITILSLPQLRDLPALIAGAEL